MRLLSLLLVLSAVPAAQAVQRAPDLEAWRADQVAAQAQPERDVSVAVERHVRSHRRSTRLTFVADWTLGAARLPHLRDMEVEGRPVNSRRAARLDPVRTLAPRQRVWVRALTAAPYLDLAFVELSALPVRDGDLWRFDVALVPPAGAPARVQADTVSLWLTGGPAPRLVRSLARLTHPRGSSRLLVETAYERRGGLDLLSRRTVRGVFVIERRGRGFSFDVEETQQRLPGGEGAP